jgi:class 3 adenylate cyclase
MNLLKKILPLGFHKFYVKSKPKFKKYNQVCVLFTDIVSYCDIAGKYTDVIIYLILNEMYTRFDKLILKYPNLQKIETIGDSYMVVGNLYDPEGDDIMQTVKEIITFGLELLSETPKIKTPAHKLSIRVGIHVGHCVVGILGRQVPRLCIVGNTVNKANRIQTAALTDTLQISSELYELTKNINFDDDLNFNCNKNIPLKNIGNVDTYTVKKNR